MPNVLTFKTNPVSRTVNGLSTKTELLLPVELANIETEAQLKRALMQEINKQGLHVHIVSITINNRALTHISELQRHEKACDYRVEVIELSQHEMDALRIIKVLKEEIKHAQIELAENSSTRGLLMEQLTNLESTITKLTVKVNELRTEMLEKMEDLRRLIPSQKLAVPITAGSGQKGTIFANNTVAPPLSIREDLEQPNAAMQQSDLIPAGVSNVH